MFSRHEMQELIVVDGRARGIVTRDMVTGKIDAQLADAVVLATGGYGNVFFLATYAKGCNGTAIWRAYKKGAAFANPCFTQIHPTCIPVHGDYQSKLTLMSESLRNDGRIWVPKAKGDSRRPDQIPEDERDYYLERLYPTYGNLAPRDISSRAAKRACDEGRGVGPGGLGVYLDFADAIGRLGEDAIREKYGNLFDMYERITDEDPYKVPMRIFPAVALHHGRPVGGLRPHEQHPRPARHRRGQLLRPRREPPGCQRADAGPRGRLLRHPLHHRPLPGLGQARQGGRRPSRGRGGEGGSRIARMRACCRSAASGRSRPSTASSERSCGSTAGWRATEGASRPPCS